MRDWSFWVMLFLTIYQGQRNDSTFILKVFFYIFLFTVNYPATFIANVFFLVCICFWCSLTRVLGNSPSSVLASFNQLVLLKLQKYVEVFPYYPNIFFNCLLLVFHISCHHKAFLLLDYKIWRINLENDHNSKFCYNLFSFYGLILLHSLNNIIMGLW